MVAGTHQSAAGQIYNVHDDVLPTCRQYLRAYKKNVTKIRSISVPYFGVKLLSSMVTKYNRYSKGQLPAILTPYKAASQWGGNRFDNSKLRSIGWKQLVPTADGLQRSFVAFRNELNAARARNPACDAAPRNPAETSIAELRSNSEELVVGALLRPRVQWQLRSPARRILRVLRKTGRRAKLVVFVHARSATTLQWVRNSRKLRSTFSGCPTN